MKYIFSAQDRAHSDELGGKAAALQSLCAAGVNIPAWVTLSPRAFDDSLEQGRPLSLAPAVRAELEAALRALCPQGELLAVRSSGLEEDGVRHSFAGQFESFLMVAPSDVAEKVLGVWQSAFNQRVQAYRRERGLGPLSQAPAVLIQHMVLAEISGVAFSADPLTGQSDVAVVSAVRGLGDALVSGRVNADTYRVNLAGQVTEALPAGEQLLLNEAQLRDVALLARRAEEFFGCPQDVEWAIQSGQLFLLQSRPITTLAQSASRDDFFNLWDNSNIAESYPGHTLPLTFSFARRAYEEVYRQFCRMMGVPGRVIEDNAATFRRMLGLRQGRMYYNLLSWYRVLAMLPGYKLNRRFMEQMMGVRQSLPDALVSQAQPPQTSRWMDALYVIRTLFGLALNYLMLPARIRAFYGRLDAALGTLRPDMGNWPSNELVTDYRRLEKQLLSRWDAPLINDFFAMIFYGLLRGLVKKWCKDAQETLQNNLLASTGGIISAEPVTRIREMAGLAAQDEGFVSLLCDGALPEILSAIPARPAFERRYLDYLEKFGDRCLEELKLENPTLHDEPLVLLRAVGNFARRKPSSPASLSDATEEDGESSLDISELAEAQAHQALKGSPARRALFDWVLRNARNLVRNRENLRFERTRVFGRARRIMLELGRRFQSAGLLVEARDVFYLEIEEVLGTVDGVASTADLNGLVRVRKEEFARYRALPAPPDRFETRGLPASARVAVSVVAQPGGETLQGLGCSPGLVRGRVRVVTDPRAAILQAGEILVSDHTDPGWILLFSAASGLLVEHGSLLSHAAIVSREMGLPCVVSLPRLTHWLNDGEWVEFDGSTGLVRKIEPQA